MNIRPTPRHDDLLGVTSDQHHAKIHANSHVSGGADTIIIGSSPIDLHHSEHVSGGADTIIIGSSPIDLHHNEHLSGGADPLPWGAGGGLDIDKLDGYDLSQILTLSDDINYPTEVTKSVGSTYVLIKSFTLNGRVSRVVGSVDLKNSVQSSTTYFKLRFNNSVDLVLTFTTTTTYQTFSFDSSLPTGVIGSTLDIYAYFASAGAPWTFYMKNLVIKMH